MLALATPGRMHVWSCVVAACTTRAWVCGCAVCVCVCAGVGGTTAPEAPARPLARSPRPSQDARRGAEARRHAVRQDTRQARARGAAAQGAADRRGPARAAPAAGALRAPPPPRSARRPARRPRAHSYIPIYALSHPCGAATAPAGRAAPSAHLCMIGEMSSGGPVPHRLYMQELRSVRLESNVNFFGSRM